MAESLGGTSQRSSIRDVVSDGSCLVYSVPLADEPEVINWDDAMEQAYFHSPMLCKPAVTSELYPVHS